MGLCDRPNFITAAIAPAFNRRVGLLRLNPMELGILCVDYLSGDGGVVIWNGA